MEELIPLIKLIKTKKISDKYILKSVTESNKQDKLFIAIKRNKIKTDDEAIKYLYGINANDHSYNRMKRRLKEKLYNSLVTLDQTKHKYTSHKKAMYKVMKQYVVANMLKLEKQTFLMIKVLEDTIKQAVKYELTEYVKLISKLLIQHYSISSRNIKKLEKYQDLYSRYSKIEENEFIANMYYSELSKLYTTKTSKQGAFMEKLIQYSNELKEIQKEISSFEFNHKTFSILSTRYIFEGNYQETIDNANEAVKFFSVKPFETNRSEFTFSSDKIIALMLMKKHQDAEILISKTLSIVDENSFNYFKLQYYRFQNFALHEQFQYLPSLIESVFEKSNLRKYNVQFELWKIRQAYTNFLIEAEIIDTNDEFMTIPFRVGRFLNEVPIFSKEKRGMNISILVVQILYMLVRKKYNDVIDRIDALKQYSFRYLRNDDTFRSNCFIKMIIKIPQADFHPLRSKLHARELCKKLNKHKINIIELTNEIEVIPFHYLWKIILKVLEKNL